MDPVLYQIKRLDYHQRQARIEILKSLNASIKAEFSLPSAFWEGFKKRILTMAQRMGSPLNAVPNKANWRAKTFTVATAGTPVNLDDIAVPDGFSVAIRAAIANGANLVYVANSSANTASATNRFILRAGDTIILNITNYNLIWIDGNANGVIIESIIEA
jgi:hypothetical protein